MGVCHVVTIPRVLAEPKPHLQSRSYAPLELAPNSEPLHAHHEPLTKQGPILQLPLLGP